MSRYDHKIETSLEGIEHLSKEENETPVYEKWAAVNQRSVYIRRFERPRQRLSNKRQSAAV